MPIKCYVKPVRSQPRYFSTCDVARIAKNAVDDNGIPPEIVLACVARRLGFKTMRVKKVSVRQSFVAPVPQSAVVIQVVGVIRTLLALFPAFALTLQRLEDQLSKFLPTPEDEITVDVEAVIRTSAGKARKFLCCEERDALGEVENVLIRKPGG